MLIPLGTDRPLRRPTVATYALVIASVAIYCAQSSLQLLEPEQADRAVQLFWLDPARVTPWGLITYAFLHGGLGHLLGNMVFLWVFGPNVEDRLGRIGFLIFYFIGAAVAGGLHALFERGPVVGASGAISAVTGAYLVLFPHTSIKTLFLLGLGIFGVPAWWFIGGQIAWNLFMQASGRTGDIAVLAHLGGYGYGFVVAMLLLWTRILSRETYDLFTITRQAARRRQFREVTYQRERLAREGKNPDMAMRAGKHDDARSEALMQARARVTTPLAEDRLDQAAAAYRALLDEHGAVPGASLLGRRQQYDLANYLFQSGDHTTAATAYDLFLKGYPSDPELPIVRLMLGMINARYLNDPVRAKQEIGLALPALPEGEYKALARELLAELG